jgi:predicted 3-demethylubiquinone-9 3-methyltransferase (glyoxalase superfamily)
MLKNTDLEKVERVTEAMLKMKRIDIKTLIDAYGN